MKKIAFFITYLLCVFTSFAQKSFNQTGSTTATTNNSNRTGVGYANVVIKYAVRNYSKNQVYVAVSYDRVHINPQAGYIYEGIKYGNEVPGLMDLLRNTSGSYPRVSLDVYYGAYKIKSHVIQISARNDLSTLMGDGFFFEVSPDQLNSPNFSVKATSLESFNYSPDPTIGWALKDRVTSYLKDKKREQEYNDLIQTADRFYQNKKYEEARSNYYKSLTLKDDPYPKAQMKLIDEAMKALRSKAEVDKIVEVAKSFENEGDLYQALSSYERANALSNSSHQSDIRRIQDKIQQKKREEEARLAEIEKKRQEIQQKQELELKQKEEAIIIANQQLEEEIKREEELAFQEAEAELERETRRKLEEERLENRKYEEQQRLIAEEKRKAEEKKKAEERTTKLNSEISRAEKNMFYDPVLYRSKVAEADGYYNAAMSANPSNELAIESEWWMHSSFMESVKRQLEEPKRQEAWARYQSKIEEQNLNFLQAKYSYLEAINYTDKDSPQHKWLVKQIKMMDSFAESYKDFLKISVEQEQIRRSNVNEAIAFREIKRQNDNKAAASLLYSHRIQNQMYGRGGEQNGNALMNSMYLEQRLNQAQAVADAQQVASATITHSILEIADGKSLADYAHNSWGIDIYLNGLGVVSMPLVMNEYNVNNSADPLNSSLDNGFFMSTGFGTDIWLNKGNYWDLSIGGEIMVGWLPFAGHNNFYYNPTGILKANFGIKPIKLAVEIHQGYTGGSTSADTDVSMASNSQFDNIYQSATELLTKSKFGYGYGRYGAGLNMTFNDYTYMRLLAYAEKPSFHHEWNFKKPPMVFELVLVMNDNKYLINYGPNYPMAGHAEKMITRSHTGGNYLKFQLMCPIWTLFNSRSK